MGGKAERAARNETIFREVNERIEDATNRIGALRDAEFLCECGDVRCTERINLAVAEWAIRRPARRHNRPRPRSTTTTHSTPVGAPA